MAKVIIRSCSETQVLQFCEETQIQQVERGVAGPKHKLQNVLRAQGHQESRSLPQERSFVTN